MVSSYAISNILTNPDATGRVAKWVIELGPWDIKYAHPRAIKAQVLPDFTTEWIEAQLSSVLNLSNAWTMYFDGSKKYDGAGAGVILISPKGDKLRYVLQIHFDTTNNGVEYEALLHGMRVAKEIGVKLIYCYGDSDLVVHDDCKCTDRL